jgi:hypothetical protein
VSCDFGLHRNGYGGNPPRGALQRRSDCPRVAAVIANIFTVIDSRYRKVDLQVPQHGVERIPNDKSGCGFQMERGDGVRTDAYARSRKGLCPVAHQAPAGAGLLAGRRGDPDVREAARSIDGRRKARRLDSVIVCAKDFHSRFCAIS